MTHTAPPSNLSGQRPTFDAVRELIRSRGLEFADFWFTDLAGKPWRITMPAAAVDEKLFTDGLPLDGQPVGGSWDGVMLLVPRADAVYHDPVAAAPTLAMICDTLDPGAKQPFAAGSRHVLQLAEQRLLERSGARVVLGAEPEFLLLDGEGSLLCEGVVWDFLRELAVELSRSGMEIDWYRFGPAAGQGRVQMHPGSALRLADHVMMYRHVASTLARRRGLIASFLPRPAAGSGTPGMPVHQALWKDGRNIFHDDQGWARTSDVCRWYAGGLLAHLPALLALCAPTTNSYRRLIPGAAGPTDTLLSQSLRTAACRIPARDSGPGARRIKFWPPDPTANPYLAFAAILLAGLDGVERGIEAPVDGAKPLYASLPQSLEGALEHLDADRDFLTHGGVFTHELIDAWIKDRWTHHILPLRQRPHPWELLNSDLFNQGRGSGFSRDLTPKF